MRRPIVKLGALPLATNALCRAVVVRFEGRPLDPVAADLEWRQKVDRAFAAHAERLVDALWKYAPGGLVDAIFAEICRRKASVLGVAHERTVRRRK